jgi:probable addiction module antidote protein
MPIETSVFDPAAYFDNDEACAAYMTDSLETGDPAFIADALHVIARARGLDRTVSEPDPLQALPHHTPNGDGTSDLGQLPRILHALGFRLTVTPAAP